LEPPVALVLACVMTIFTLYAVICCILTPERSLADRLAGTWMVPR
jgi:hypothetical protein